MTPFILMFFALISKACSLQPLGKKFSPKIPVQEDPGRKRREIASRAGFNRPRIWTRSAARHEQGSLPPMKRDAAIGAIHANKRPGDRAPLNARCAGARTHGSASARTSFADVMQSASVNLSRCLKKASRAPFSTPFNRQQGTRVQLPPSRKHSAMACSFS